MVLSKIQALRLIVCHLMLVLIISVLSSNPIKSITVTTEMLRLPLSSVTSCLNLRRDSLAMDKLNRLRRVNLLLALALLVVARLSPLAAQSPPGDKGPTGVLR